MSLLEGFTKRSDDIINRKGIPQVTLPNIDLSWLSCDDYEAQFNGYISQRQEGTGTWLLESKEFEAWIENDTRAPVLFCHGPPGAGKTILAATVVENLRMKYEDQQNIIVTHLYCNFRLNQKVDQLLASSAKQLAKNPSLCPEALKKLGEQCQNQKRQPKLREIASLIQSLTPLYARVFVVIDALDECPETGGNRERFLYELLQLQMHCKFQLFATSRPLPGIQDKFQASHIANLEIRASEHDIRIYLEANMSRLPKFVSQDDGLQEEIKSNVVSSADGM